MNSFIDLGEFEAIKVLNGRRTLHCDKNQFCNKMTVSIQTVFEISLLNIVVLTGKKEYEKWDFRYCTLLYLAIFHEAFGATLMSLADHKALKEEVWILK